MPQIDWSSLTGNPACSSSAIIIDMDFSINLRQCVSQSTHPFLSGGSVIDLIFISPIYRRGFDCVVVGGICDHLVPCLEFFGPGTTPCLVDAGPPPQYLIFLELMTFRL